MAALAGALSAVESARGSEYYGGSKAVALAPGISERQAVREKLTPDANGIVITMVGLPARGKSFISRKVERFLKWRGLETRMFNVGMYRRDAVAPEQSGRSEFFDANNRAALAARENAAVAALVDALAFLDGGGQIAILDATNSTRGRRRRIREQVQAHHNPYAVLFVEAICDDVELLDANMQSKVENSPDFKDMSQDLRLVDLRSRIAKYEAVYETVQDDEGPSIKLYNLSSKVMANHCYGRIAKSILPYLMAIHIGARPIWLVRAGAGKANPQSPSTGDRLSKLSDAGHSFAVSLADFVRGRADRYWQATGRRQGPTHVVTSTMPRAVASVTTLQHEQTSALNPIDKGAVGSGWWDVECYSELPPWEDMERLHPELISQMRRDPVRCRFPGGESYMDVIRRLEGLLLEIEMCTRPVLIVSHITVLQLLVTYFSGLPIEDAWKLPIPKNTVFEVTPTSGGGFLCEQHALLTDPADGGGVGAGEAANGGSGSPEAGEASDREDPAKRRRLL